MKARFGIIALCFCAALVLQALLMPVQARAAITITLETSTDGTTWNSPVNFTYNAGPDNYTINGFSFNGISFTTLVVTSQDGVLNGNYLGAYLQTFEGTASYIGVNGDPNGTKTAFLRVTASGFESPVAPADIAMSSGLTGQRKEGPPSAGGSSTATLLSTVTDGTNTVSTAAQSISLLPATTVSSTEAATITELDDPYKMVQVVSITLSRTSTGVRNQSITFTADTSLSQVVPEPASMAIWGLGGAALAFGTRFRRRRKA